jgi:hypothetical protein
MCCGKPYVEDMGNPSRYGHLGTGIFETVPAI